MTQKPTKTAKSIRSEGVCFDLKLPGLTFHPGPLLYFLACGYKTLNWSKVRPDHSAAL